MSPQGLPQHSAAHGPERSTLRAGRRLLWAGAAPRSYIALAFAVLAVLAVIGALAGPATAAPGDLDPSFGAGGQVVTDVSPFGNERARAVAVQGDGKLVVAVQDPSGSTTTDSALLRYARDGRLDSSFGTDGKVSLDIEPEDVAIQPDGKILVAAGGFAPDGSREGFIVARFLADGSVDAAFGTGGRVISRFPNIRLSFAVVADVKHVAVQPDGRIVASGDKCENQFGTYDRAIAVVRYLPDGSPDASFSTDGLAQVQSGGGGSSTFCPNASMSENEKDNGLALQDDGNIVVVGARGDSTRRSGDFFVARLLGSGPAAGDLDTGFGTAGTVSTDIRGNDVSRDVVIQNGKIVVAGSATDATGGGFALVRYLEDGSLDPSFDGDGKVVTDSGQLGGTFALGRALAVQDDGKLVVAGCTLGCGPDSTFALARYAPDGALDGGFGAAGTIATSLAQGGSFANDLAIDPADQGLLVVGGVHVGAQGDVALARYTAQAADLSLSGGASPDPVTVGQQLTYTLTVTNGGPDVARSLTVSDSLSTRVSFASSETSQGTCGPELDGRSVSCALAGLASGASARVSIVVTANRAGAATNSASVSSATTDADASDNSVSASTTIAPGPGSGPSPFALPDTKRPVVRGLRVVPGRFRIGSRLPRLAGAARVGTEIRFSLSERAMVRLSFARRLSGRRVGHGCRVASRRLRGRPRCTRYVGVSKSVRIAGAHAGANGLRFQGRLSAKRRLRPGRYRLAVIATDAAGNRSRPARTRLTARRRPPPR